LHALVGVWTATPAYTGRARRHALTLDVPTLPGFVQGYWSADAETGKVHSFILFDHEEGARRCKATLESSIREHALAGLTYDRLSVVEVTAIEAGPGQVSACRR
jgi:hypothetical protein